MIDIKGNINKSYEETKINKLLFNGISWIRRIDTWIFLIGLILGITSILLVRNLRYSDIYTLIVCIILFIGLLTLINREYKKRMVKNDIKVDDEKFHWASEEYEILKLSKFYDSLVENKVLANSELDVDLLTDYELLYDDEASFFKSNQNYIYGGGVVLLFVVPVWIEIVNQLFKEMQKGQLLETIKLIFGIIAMVYLITYMLYGINAALLEFTNSISKKHKNISRLLRLIRLNLRLKYLK